MKYLPEPAFFFRTIALLAGMSYACLIPPFQSPDEPNHFLRAYQVSQGHWLPEKTTDQRLGGVLPESLQAVADSFAFLKNNTVARTTLHSIQTALQITLKPDKTRFLDFANTGIYAPTAYLPQALALAVLRPFGATPLQMLYGCRLMNLLVWIALVFGAIRKMPGLRWTMTVLALLPASLVMAASCNGEVITGGLCFWLLATCWSRVDAIRGGETAAMMLATVQKLITAPFAFLGWLQPERKFRVLALVLTLAAASCWGLVAQHYFIPYDAYNPDYRASQTLNPGVQPTAQLIYIATHPLKSVVAIAGSFVRALPSAAAHLVGKFGWEKNYLPAPYLVMLWLIFGLVLFVEPNPATRRQRLVAAGIVVLYMTLFAVTMYALWCPVGAPEMDNWQGRYFLPVMPLVALACGKPMLAFAKTPILWLGTMVLLASQISMLFSIWSRYYGL
jgi:uncharacterized membrane protein